MLNQYNHIIRFATILFFAGFFVLGNTIIDDYGLGFDDEIQEQHGWVSYDYINSVLGIETKLKAPTEKPLSEYSQRSYGMLFQLSALYLEDILGLDTYVERHKLRHLMVFYLFFLASIFFYRILLRQFENPYLALLGTLIFILSPRTFGHAFFNIKDSVLLSFFVFGMASFFRYLDKPSIRNGVLHALICGLVVNIRIVGIIMPVLSIAWIIVYFMAAKDKKSFWNQWKKSLGFFILLTPVFITIFWPFLWENPVKNFLEAYKTMGNFSWLGFVLFSKLDYYVTDLPWYYAPKWMLISIPLFYWALFFFGIIQKPIFWIKDLFKGNLNWFNDRDNRFLAISLSFFLLPLLVVIIKKSTLYDGWRHLHFIYVGFLLVTCHGLVMLYRYAKKNKVYRNIYLAIVGSNIAYLLFVMIQIHPYQQTYFNLLAPHNQFEYYELDYWGISYLSGFRALAELIPEGECWKVYSFSIPGEMTYKILDEDIKNKIILGKRIEESDYYITNFRYEKERINFLEKKNELENPVIVLERRGVPIMGVFKLDNVENE